MNDTLPIYVETIRKRLQYCSHLERLIQLVVYPDEDDMIKKGVTDRLALNEMVTWYGI